MKISTIAVHGGLTDTSHYAAAFPVYLTSTFIQKGPTEFREYGYSRTANPTRSDVEKHAADIEGAALALTAAFGFAASAAHAEDLDDIKARGVITIGTEGVYAPYTYHDEKGRLTGYDVEVGRAIAKKLGVEAKFVETPWDALIAGIDAKRYEALCVNQGRAPCAQRQREDQGL